MQPNTKNRTIKLCIFALYMALICLVTMFTKIPIPLGYAHLGDCLILIFALLYGGKAGFVVGGTGSAMADLLGGFPYWVVPTFLIKGMMAVLVSLIARDKKGKYKIYSIRTIIAVVAGMLFMVIGYVIAGGIMEGFAAGLQSAPGLLIKSVVNLIAFFILAPICQAINSKEKYV